MEIDVGGNQRWLSPGAGTHASFGRQSSSSSLIVGSNYRVGKKIGSGNFGELRLGVCFRFAFRFVVLRMGHSVARMVKEHLVAVCGHSIITSHRETGGVMWSVTVCDGCRRLRPSVRTRKRVCLTIVMSSDTRSVYCLWNSTCLMRHPA